MTNNAKRDKAIKTTLAILKFVFLIAIIVGIPTIVWLVNPGIIEHLNSVEKINQLLDENQMSGGLIYIGLQIVQVVISVIPGQPIQMAAGYAFGALWALLLSIIGISIGTIVTFYLGRVFGRDIVYLVFGEKRVAKFVELLDSTKGFVAIFILYLFPGIPKDVFSYAAGISQMRMLPFVVISIIARTPALMASLLFGKFVRGEDWIGLIIVTAIVLVCAVVGLIFRKRVYSWIDGIHGKFFTKK
jgi:uncharacterized membrane protein YdjX (TVP38/TMEM64 family)